MSSVPALIAATPTPGAISARAVRGCSTRKISSRPVRQSPARPTSNFAKRRICSLNFRRSSPSSGDGCRAQRDWPLLVRSIGLEVARRGSSRPLHHPRPVLGRSGPEARLRGQGLLRLVRRADRLHRGGDRMGRSGAWARLAGLVARWRRRAVRAVSRQGQRALSHRQLPATVLGSGLPLKLPDVIKGFNWLTFEGGKFSTSRRSRHLHGCRPRTGCPADVWRWWLAANAPEGADSDFTVARFVDGVNKDLADAFGNLVNRCLHFRCLDLRPDGSGRGRYRAGRARACRQARPGAGAAAQPSRDTGLAQGRERSAHGLEDCERLSRRNSAMVRRQTRS